MTSSRFQVKRVPFIRLPTCNGLTTKIVLVSISYQYFIPMDRCLCLKMSV